MAALSFEIDDQLLESLMRRVSVVLDTNMWINIAEQKTVEARHVRGMIEGLLNREKVFCPLMPATIWELRKQKGESIKLTTVVMEELSENVSFRSYKDICSNEIEGFIEYILYGSSPRIGLGKIYGPVLCYLASGFQLQFPEGWGAREKENLTEHVYRVINRMSLGEFIRLIECRAPKEKQEPPAYLKTNVARYEFCKGDVLKMRRVEQEHVARNTVLPMLSAKTRKRPVVEQIRFAKAVDLLPKSGKYQSAIEHVLLHMPVIHALVEVMTIAGLDTNRKDSYRDFYDKEIMINALSYADIFAADDKWIKSLMNNKHLERTCTRMKYCRNLSELGDALRLVEKNITRGFSGLDIGQG